jgi:hypothetical protein
MCLYCITHSAAYAFAMHCCCFFQKPTCDALQHLLPTRLEAHAQVLKPYIKQRPATTCETACSSTSHTKP